VSGRVAAFAILLLAGAADGQTASSDPLASTQLPDAAQERSAKALMETVRCVVCQGQSIADSDAPLAGDMRALVRHRIQAGERPEQIRAWLIRRYGYYISYDPPLGRATILLWLAPLILIGGGLWVAQRSFRRRR
jgi:cytochrome c-type biogenesis protein CcmH